MTACPEGGNTWIVLDTGAILVPKDDFEAHIAFLKRIGRLPIDKSAIPHP